MEEIIAQLNPAQREAVVNFEGPSLIVAGAGSGKTRVLTARIAYMLSQGVPPHSILSLTFTNKAASEMRERIEAMAGEGSRHIWMGTFHSIFLRLLRADAERIGYPPSFTIYDTTDGQSLIKAICKEMSLDAEKYKPRAVLSKISRLKNDLITPEVYEADAAFAADDRKRSQPQFLEVYCRYTARCKAAGAMDFDDLLLNMVVLLKRNPDVLEKYRRRFRYIMVDEYQDTNHVQYLIVKALAMAHGNVCVVGDDSQSIYSFRGARIENILGFKRDFPAARLYKLEQNYRSTQVIVSAANGVIARNSSSRELKKECFSAGERGENIKLLRAYTDREEAEMVASEIKQLGRDGVQWEDIAVLYRVNALSRGVEEALRRREIPYKIYRGHSFFDRKEIKDVLAYLRLIANPHDEEAFRRVINYPARGIGEVTVGRLIAAAREAGVSLWDAASASDDRKLRGFVELVGGLAAVRTEMSLYEFGRAVATRTGIIGSYKADNSAESVSALENIEELLNTMAEERVAEMAAVYGDEDEGAGDENAGGEGGPATLEEWLGGVALMSDMDGDDADNRNKVSLMTVHSSKGLEFRHVFIVGLEEELFPSVRDGDSDEIEEERRLFYVALTRAKDRSFVSMAQMRYIHGNMTMRRPSRFVREIDSQFLDGTLSDDAPTGFGQAERPTWEARKPDWGPRKPNVIKVTDGSSGYDPCGGARGGGYTQKSSYGQGSGGGYSGRPSGGGYARGESGPAIKVAPVTPDARFRKVSSSESGRGYSESGASTGYGRNVDGGAGYTPGSGGGATSGGGTASAGGSVGGFAAGVRVSHAKFGRGTVQEVEAAAGASGPADLKITVAFDDAAHGRKTLLSKFAKLEIL